MAAEHRMIEPFEPNQVKYANGHRIVSYGTSSYGYDIRCSDEFKLFHRIVSYGTSSYGYDIRCSDEFKLFTNINSVIVDPKNFDSNSFVDVKGDVCLIPPNSFALARTVEYFRIPRNVFSNTTPLPAKIYANEGVAQVIFFESDEVCEVSYKDRGGKYQGQHGVTLPKI